MHQFFSLAETARRYNLYRPKVHAIVLDWLAKCFGPKRWRHAIDIACGTGDSTMPLLQICDQVLGIDASPEMLRYAQAKGLATRMVSYAELDEVAQYDLVSTCMAFHWFDQAQALAVYKQISAPGAAWIIYRFVFGGHGSNAKLNAWFQEYYLKTYPAPPRNRPAPSIPAADTQIELVAYDQGVLPIEFTPEGLVNYLSTQSNIEAAVKNGHDYDAIYDNLVKRVRDFDLTGHFRYRYTYQIYLCQGGK